MFKCLKELKVNRKEEKKSIAQRKKKSRTVTKKKNFFSFISLDQIFTIK